MFEVDAWLWSLEVPADCLPVLWETLTDDERKRAERFVYDVHRDRYVVGRGRLREILGAETGRDPRDVVFHYGVNGKPGLEDGPEFNLSHSDTLAALAISRDGALGIDIEKARPIEDAVARLHFSPTEYAQLDRMQQGAWLDGFYRCWTRKEAVIKTNGLGLSMPLDSFDVSLTSTARLVRIEGDTPDAWRMVHFDPAPGYSGALAARTGGREIHLNWRTGGP